MRPNDSEIFKALKQQDISRIRKMIADGQASIRDINEKYQRKRLIFALGSPDLAVDVVFNG